jgi:hypothetical protein
MKEKLPQDTDTKIYIKNLNYSLQELVDICKAKWDIDDLLRFKLDFEEIQVKCFGYDQYDPSDYREYLVITLDIVKDTH